MVTAAVEVVGPRVAIVREDTVAERVAKKTSAWGLLVSILISTVNVVALVAVVALHLRPRRLRVMGPGLLPMPLPRTRRANGQCSPRRTVDKSWFSLARRQWVVVDSSRSDSATCQCVSKTIQVDVQQKEV